jgi:hypothetical protein
MPVLVLVLVRVHIDLPGGVLVVTIEAQVRCPVGEHPRRGLGADTGDDVPTVPVSIHPDRPPRRGITVITIRFAGGDQPTRRRLCARANPHIPFVRAREPITISIAREVEAILKEGRVARSAIRSVRDTVTIAIGDDPFGLAARD